MDLEQLEALAWGDDRADALDQLIPGTEDYYYYHCLHHQQAGELDEVDKLLVTWEERHGETTRYEHIRCRQALSSYERSPDKTLEFLRDALHTDHSHQREVEGEQTAYPSALDQSHISRDALRDRAFSNHSGLHGFSESALVWLADSELDASRRSGLLERLQRPDYPRLVDHILADLDRTKDASFSVLSVVGTLTLDQLEELARRRPSLLNNEQYVNIRLTRLRPGPDVAWQTDQVELSAYLDRLWSFVESLAPAFNSLRAHVLYHRLDLDRKQNVYDAARFEDYLKLPRQASYVADKLLRTTKQSSRAQLGYQGPTDLPAIGSDEELVRDYFAHLFAEADDYDRYTPYVRESFLSRGFATTKILLGVGDHERWYSMLDDPSGYQALKERVDIDFTCRNREYFGAGDSVTLEVDVKNVKTLVVKVFEINTLSYFLAHRRDVDTSIDLDGLVASEETTHHYEEPPLRRVRRTFELLTLAKPGVYVVELIGGGKSSRALVRKGHLRYVERVGAAGHALTVIGEDGEVAADATVWLGAREHRANEDGEVLIPFSTNPRRERILLRRGDVTTLETLEHQSESYSFSAGIYVEREELIGGETASVVVRPQLSLNGVAVSATLLEEVVLAIKCDDLHGVSARVEVFGFELSDEAESVHAFSVPEEVASVEIELRAKVRNISKQEDVDLRAAKKLEINAIDKTSHVESLFLTRSPGGYVVRVLGKSGEPRSGRLVTFDLTHRDFTDTVMVYLQTDADGRIDLGALDGIRSIHATTQAGLDENWHLLGDRYAYTDNVHARTGDDVRIPYVGCAAEVDVADVTLLERRGGGFLRDCLDAATIDGGFLVLRGLSAGDYLLVLREHDVHIDVRITGGEARAGWAIAAKRLLELSPRAPLHIAKIANGGDGVDIRVANPTARTRVHVFARRFESATRPFSLAGGRREVGRVEMSPVASDYLSGRDIGDEYRYILERKHADKYPGNMLKRPGLLLNPWERRSTDADLDMAGGGGEYAKKSARGGRSRAPSPKKRARKRRSGHGFGNLDFLAQPGLVALNLRPDAEGRIRIEADRAAPYSSLVVVAIDGAQTVARETSLADAALDTKDRRLSDGLPADEHFTEKNEISALLAGDSVTIDDPATAKVETVDTLASVYSLYSTLSGNSTLSKFSFVIEWPGLDDDAKRAKYSEYACHELSLFLYFKDRAFFDSTIEPYLRNKLHKTFIDHYLLGDDLSGYLESWAYSQLNIVERVLLGGRVEGQRGPTARHVRDLFDLLTPDPEGDEHLFRTVLQGSVLAPTSTPLGEIMAQPQEGGAAPMRASLMQAPKAAAAGGPPMPPPAAAPASTTMMMDAMEMEADDDFYGEAAAEEEVERGDYKMAKSDAARRESSALFYRKLDATKEWAENNYYELTPSQQGPGLVTVNGFWLDLADHDGEGPFLSSHFIRATSSFTEMMCALAVLDLPFVAAEHQVSRVDQKVRIVAGGPAVVFHKQIKPAEPAAERVPILVSQNYFRADDRYRYEGNERIDKYVTDEFLNFTVYLCQVVLTNPTSSRQKLQLLLQIPEGALPVSSGFDTRGMHVTLESYATQSIEYSFYFPKPGVFPHFPVHASKNEKLIASADPTPLNVVQTLSKIDTESWPHVSQHASSDEVLRYMRENNIERLEMHRIAWRMRDRAFYDQVIELLTERHVYAWALWQYSLLHGDAAQIRELLSHQRGFLSECGGRLDTPIAVIDPVATGWFEHLEYEPLINARAHQLGGRVKILNDAFSAQYGAFCHQLTFVAEPTADDLLAATYYLLLQDRVGDAVSVLGRVVPDSVTTHLQFDYLTAYMALYRGDLPTAREMVGKHEGHPVDRWRKVFEAVGAVLDEAEGAATAVVDSEDRAQAQNELAAAQPGFDFEVDSNAVTVSYQNLVEVRVSYYLMDIELLFSRQPFVQQGSDRFSIIRPNRTETLALPAGRNEITFDIPAEYGSRNVIVEIVSAGQRKSHVNYANDLVVQLVEQYGQVRVSHRATSRPLPSSYVKVYARKHGGSVVFYKDGYTDVRGVFDYTTLSNDEIDQVEKFAVLISSDDHGAIVREVAPPKR
jgi:hypothetical protein